MSGKERLRRRCGSRKERKERKDCGRVDVGDVLTQRRRDAEYAERYEPRNTLNTRNANTTRDLRPIHLRRRDERKRLVQVADIISGSLRIWFVRGLNIDEKHKRLRALLREKEISLKCWPVLYSVPESIPVDSTNDEMDNRICETMLTTAANLIARYESSDKIEELRRCEVLKRLIEAKIEGRTVYCDYLIEMVNRGGSRPIGRKAFLSEVIGGLRREGIVITGTNKGYSLATTMSDIRAYLHQDRTVILPMLSKLECARKTLRMNSQIDILLGEENKELKACVDAMSNLHLSKFANQQEIDDENVIPTE